MGTTTSLPLCPKRAKRVGGRLTFLYYLYRSTICQMMFSFRTTGGRGALPLRGHHELEPFLALFFCVG